METPQAADLGPDPALVSLLAFWADAGVETGFKDAPIDRLAPSPAPVQARPEEPQRSPVSAPRSEPGATQRGGWEAQVERARALAQAATDWPELLAAIERFEGAPRPRGGVTILPRGARTPAFLVIAEGPSAEDEAAGLPLTGRLGAVLDRMLAAAGVQEQALILPTAFWRARDRNAGAGLEAVCAPFIERAVTLLQPRALLLAGEAAVRSTLNRSEPILQARGRWTEWRSSAGPEAASVPALPVFHPGFLLQHPAAKKRTWADLLSLAERLG